MVNPDPVVPKDLFDSASSGSSSSVESFLELDGMQILESDDSEADNGAGEVTDTFLGADGFLYEPVASDHSDDESEGCLQGSFGRKESEQYRLVLVGGGRFSGRGEYLGGTEMI